MTAIRIDGMEQLQKLMAELPDKIQRQVAVAGVRLAGSRLRTFMRRHIRATVGKTGTLEKSITMKYGKGKNVAKVTVGLNNRFYYKTLDQGRKAYFRKNRKGTRFFVSSTPVMSSQGLNLERVWETHKDEILKVLVDGMKTELFKTMGKMALRSSMGRR